jgi:hypothetical protein
MVYAQKTQINIFEECMIQRTLYLLLLHDVGTFIGVSLSLHGSSCIGETSGQYQTKQIQDKIQDRCYIIYKEEREKKNFPASLGKWLLTISQSVRNQLASDILAHPRRKETSTFLLLIRNKSFSLTYIHTHTYIHMECVYVYIYICVCVCICAFITNRNH